jgi:hypothetical protein
MRFFYTTTTGADKENFNPLLSLGGYQSSPVPNTRNNNLFSDITQLSILQNEPSYIGLFLQNTTGADVANIKLWFEYPENCYSKIEIAAVLPSLDPEGNPIIENINNIHSQPYDGDFYESNGQDNAVDLGELANNGLLGIWFKRTILTDAITTDYKDLFQKQGDRYIQKTLGVNDQIQFKLSWDLAYGAGAIGESEL